MLNRRALGHLHYFTRETAFATLQDSGYIVLDWFYTPAGVDLAQPGLKSAIANVLRRTCFRFAPEKSVLTLGGYALMVLTEGEALC